MNTPPLPIAEFIDQWNDCTLHRDHWNHFGHLRAALYYLVNTTSEFEAISTFRCKTIQYALATNPGYSCTIQYHQTVTVFWILKLNAFKKRHSGKTFEELEVLLKKSRLINKFYIHRFYSTEVMASQEARAIYLKPDLKP